MSMAGLYEGAVASEERWDRKRSDARAAFMEFMKMFPNASAEDYRSYVNEITGGNSFLRGGIPTDQVLNKLAQDRQQQYAQEQMQMRIQTLSGQAQLSGQVDALASKYALDIADDNKLTEALASSLGYNKNDPATAPILGMVQRQYPNGYGGIRSSIQQELFDKNLPNVLRIIESNPNLTDDQLMALTPGMDQNAKGPQRNMLLQILGSAREQYKAKSEQARQERIQKAVQDARTQIDANGEYALPNLPGDDLAEAQRLIDPYKKGYETKRQNERRTMSLNAMSEYAKSASAVPGFSISMSRDPNVALQFKETLRRVGSIDGYTPDDADLNQFVALQNIAGRSTGEEKDKEALRSYDEQLRKAASTPGATARTLPIPPSIADPDIRKQAMDLLTAQQDMIERSQREAESRDAAKAVDTVSNAIIGDPDLMGQISRGDIKPDQITGIIADRLRVAHPDKPISADMLLSVQKAVIGRVDTLRSSKVVTEQDALKSELTKANEGATKAGKEVLADIIAKRTQDGEGNETETTSILKMVVANITENPNSGVIMTPQLATAMANYMTPSFVKDHNGDVNAMTATILSELNPLISASKRQASAFSPEFPYGDRRGSKTLITKNIPAQVIKGFDEPMAKVQAAYSELVRAQQNDDPSTTADTAMAVDKFNAAWQEAHDEIQRRGIEAVNLLAKAKEKSRIWSSDGEIDDNDVAEVRSLLAKEGEKRFSELDALKAKSTEMIISLGVRPEDQVMRTSQRIDEQRRSAWTPEEAAAAKEAAKGAKDAGVGSTQLLRAIEDVGVESVGQEWTDEEKLRIAKEQGLSDAMIRDLLGK